MHPYLAPLQPAFRRHAHAGDAAAMHAYMKGIAPFFGIRTPLRRQLLKAHIAAYGRPSIEELPAIARSAFAQAEREWHYMAVDLLMKEARQLNPTHLSLVDELVTTKSWWDTVDALAANVAGVVLKRYPKEVAKWNARWIGSDNMWLNRTAILFQLKWKDDTDAKLLFANIRRHAAHKDFCIRKAIGWALREYSGSDPFSVKAFVKATILSPLSAREALRKLPTG